MNDLQGLLLVDVERQLRRDVEIAVSKGGLGALFASWVLGQQEAPSDCPAAIAALGQGHSYQRVAGLGFAAAISRSAPSSELVTELNWLLERPLTTGGSPAAVTRDPIALVGVLLGCKAAWDQVSGLAQPWIPEAIRRLGAIRGIPAWMHTLVIGVASSATSEITAPIGGPDDSSDARLVLADRGIGRLPEELSRSGTSAIRLILGSVEPQDLRAPLLLKALLVLREATASGACHLSTSPSDADVVQLLRGISAGMARWTWEQRSRTGKGLPVVWQVDHEYHVQNLLFLVLRSVFPDLKDEESLSSIGHNHPRIDFVIPSLRLGIEVKFIQNGRQDEWKRLIEEIASDAALYRKDRSVCDRFVAFVWDDSMRSEEHAKAEAGLREIEGVVGAVVMSRPGRMGRTASSDGGS